MELGMIGLGRMGSNMAQRLTLNQHRVIGYDAHAAARDNARAVLLQFAQDFSAAETKSEIVKVMSRLDEYVDRLSSENR